MPPPRCAERLRVLCELGAQRFKIERAADLTAVVGEATRAFEGDDADKFSVALGDRDEPDAVVGFLDDVVAGLARCGRPSAWILIPYWSDQKDGIPT